MIKVVNPSGIVQYCQETYFEEDLNDISVE